METKGVITKMPASEDVNAELAISRNGSKTSTKAPPRHSIAPEHQRQLPSSQDAEKGLLSSYLIDPRKVDETCRAKGINAETFHSPACAGILTACYWMTDHGKPVDVVTLMQHLADVKQLEACGGAPFVSELFTFLPTAANADYYADILLEKATLRAIIRTCTEYAARAYDEQDDATGLLDESEKAIMAIRKKRKASRMFTGKDVARIGGEQIQKAIDTRGQISGLSTGFAHIDIETDGLHQQEVIVLAGRPSEGKTALAIQIMEHISMGECGKHIPASAKKPVGVLSFEMSKNQLALRCITSRASVNLRGIRDGNALSKADMAWIVEAQKDYIQAPIYFEEVPDPTIQEIRAIGRRMRRDFGIQALLIDSLSAMKSTSRQARDSREREVAECSEGVKEMAKELEIPIILIVHLKRPDAGKPPREPKLEDLRESGKIEQDADSVWALHAGDLIYLKQRNGEKNARSHMEFLPHFAKFSKEPPKEPEAPPKKKRK